ncbi:MAG: PadR family transcriptional regulator [Thermomicrobiales bacterium]
MSSALDTQIEQTQIDTTGWDERALLLLGVLMSQDQHGYQINEFIERALCRVTTMKKPTAYALLDRLSARGYIDEYHEQAGNRPQRRVYSITPDGRSLFYALLRENLAETSSATDEGDIGLMLMQYLERKDAIERLRQRLAKVEALIADQAEIPPHKGKISVDLALDHLRAIRIADRDWLTRKIAELESESAAS